MRRRACFHGVGAEPGHDRDVRDSVRRQSAQLPFQHRPAGEAQQAFRREFSQREQSPALAGAQDHSAQGIISFRTGNCDRRRPAVMSGRCKRGKS
jgi:hypothetical protein